ncbi:hypothetical protein N7462_011034 [Penicillium macrosclerotiorum]|uniref:uncharacterized protein n=1 Tax=Penicillium macrosclerotiorum TaxID=303699 RepID=UPI002546ECBE|nr:uncharacterized protein N7462_011034 [Penicillium macrosclerotiorum]KAJ5666625.1 hypothetical protein N7462_011034 [Penicillium macrosclerotiorum]
MSKLLVVFGATGQQGGSIIDFVLNDSNLSKEYSIRAITRDVSRPAAQSLQKRGVEVVAGDVDQPSSLPVALSNAHTIFLATTSTYDDHLKSREFAQGKAVADTAIAVGAQYLIFSTCVATERLWGRIVPGFDSKAEVEEYIRSLPIQSAFFAPAMFMQNFLTSQGPRRIPSPEGEEPIYAIANFVAPDARLPMIETVADSGKYVGAILANPGKYAGALFCAATGFWSFKQAAEIITRVTGKKTIYVQMPEEQWASYLPPGSSGPLIAMMRWIEKPGYFGPQSTEKVEWTVQQMPSKLTTLEEFVEKHAEELFRQ